MSHEIPTCHCAATAKLPSYQLPSTPTHESPLYDVLHMWQRKEVPIKPINTANIIGDAHEVDGR